MIPDRLYHATFKKRVKSIRTDGYLCNERKKRSHKGVRYGDFVFLATSEEEAREFIQSADNVSEAMSNDIVVFEIESSTLDSRLLVPDPYTEQDETTGISSYVYAARIPVALLTQLNSSEDV